MRELVKIAQTTLDGLVCFEHVARTVRQLGEPLVVHLTAKTALHDPGYQMAA